MDLKNTFYLQEKTHFREVVLTNKEKEENPPKNYAKSSLMTETRVFTSLSVL